MNTTKTKPNLADIEVKIQKLVEKKRALEKKAGDNIAKLASQAGLLDLDLTDEEVLAGFKTLAETFRKAATKSDSQDPPQARGAHHDPATPELRRA